MDGFPMLIMVCERRGRDRDVEGAVLALGGGRWHGPLASREVYRLAPALRAEDIVMQESCVKDVVQTHRAPGRSSRKTDCASPSGFDTPAG